jgi:hypothetical protein
MHNDIEIQALATAEHVRETAALFIRMSEAIHHALRELAGSNSENSSSAYALLTEEYALRSRANMLMIEATRFAHPGLGITQQEMLNTLEAIYVKLESACEPNELSEIIIGVVLFANSIVSTKNNIIHFLLSELKSTLQND